MPAQARAENSYYRTYSQLQSRDLSNYNCISNYYYMSLSYDQQRPRAGCILMLMPIT